MLDKAYKMLYSIHMSNELYQVFTKGNHALVIPDEQCTFKTLQNVEQAGFVLRWDSAPSKFLGHQYAADNYKAYVPVDCKEAN